LGLNCRGRYENFSIILRLVEGGDNF